jgi:hypothetical protein
VWIAYGREPLIAGVRRNSSHRPALIDITDLRKRSNDMFKPTNTSATLLGLCLLAGLASGVSAQDPQPKAKGVNDALPRPDGKPADVSKTVKVFILMGQSNMLEMGNVAGDKDGTLEYAVKKEGLYPFLIDGEGSGPPVKM